ncbi:hypothetical protein Leryth_017511 [Lithospermum erythrorhizon]|uniref:Rad60/SUMO-like domain-containing protein n=1 Tax=Lithospermum erythrorhizon TaxID=34254 RepID=A0AAV3PH98_LITER|nr:hypothetical protein Leryth_017511 [Lithospermum erythrorhizon]
MLFFACVKFKKAKLHLIKKFPSSLLTSKKKEKMSSTSGMKRPASSMGDESGRIHVTIRAQDGTLTHCTIVPEVECGKLFKFYCEKKDLSYRSIVFLYNGTRISSKSRRTFKQLGFGDEIEIDAMEHMPGGGI